MQSVAIESPPRITDGTLHAMLVFDVADTIDLSKVANIERLAPRAKQLNLHAVPAPSYISFPSPPLSISLPDVQVLGKTCAVRAKVFDYGVLSFRISIPFEGTWADFAALSRKARQSDELPSLGQQLYAQLKQDLLPTFNRPHHDALIEDYFVFAISSFESELNADKLLSHYRQPLAALIRGENKSLSTQEADEALRLSLSYFVNDLCVIEWDSAFVYDREDALEAIIDILEFANTQLVELRTYDARLNAELDWIYSTVPVKRGRSPLGSRIASRRAQKLRLMLVDVRELIDRTNNALKIIGDAYYSRVYRFSRSRLGLGDWEKQIDDKLESVGVVYSFLSDQAQYARSELLEIIVVALFVLEVLIGLAGLH
jgi:hypothetical protein